MTGLAKKKKGLEPERDLGDRRGQGRLGVSPLILMLLDSL